MTAHHTPKANLGKDQAQNNQSGKRSSRLAASQRVRQGLPQNQQMKRHRVPSVFVADNSNCHSEVQAISKFA
jgi:hypothetical protein